MNSSPKMSLRYLVLIFLAGLLPAVLAGVAAAAEVPRVRDDAAFFSPDTVQKAGQEIIAIKRQFKVDLRIDTVPGVPADKLDQLKAKGRDQFFATWALDRAKAAGDRSVYVLICKQPAHLQVEPGEQTENRDFTRENCKALRDVLLGGFKTKEYDKALLAGIALVRDTLLKNVPPAQTGLVAGAVMD
jgi:uncharacterized membrane protein YgcG